MVMDSDTVLAKTGKGAEELAQRSGAVPQKLRAILIMVDGKTQWGELLNRYSGLPEFSEHLVWLVNNGFVEAVGKSGGTKTQAATDHVTFTSSATGRAGLIELAHHLLGAHGNNVTQRLQETEDEHDALAQTLERCYKLIRLSIDENKAEQFRKLGKKLLV